MFIFVYTTNSVAALLHGLSAKRATFQAHLDLLQASHGRQLQSR